MNEFNASAKSATTGSAPRVRKAVFRIFMEIVYAIVSILTICGLDMIGYISHDFMVILTAGSALICAFRCGYISHDIKF